MNGTKSGAPVTCRWYQAVPRVSGQGRGATSSGAAGSGGAEMQLFPSSPWTPGSDEQEPDFLHTCAVLGALACVLS